MIRFAVLQAVALSTTVSTGLRFDRLSCNPCLIPSCNLLRQARLFQLVCMPQNESSMVPSISDAIRLPSSTNKWPHRTAQELSAPCSLFFEYRSGISLISHALCRCIVWCQRLSSFAVIVAGNKSESFVNSWQPVFTTPYTGYT